MGWLEDHTTSVFTRAPLHASDLNPVVCLESASEEWCGEPLMCEGVGLIDMWSKGGCDEGLRQ